MKGTVDIGKALLKKKIQMVLIPAIPFILGIVGVVLAILVIVSPVVAAKDTSSKPSNGDNKFFERLSGFFSGNGWNTDDEAFFKLLSDEKLGCKKSTLVTATITYYYQVVPDATIEMGELPVENNAISTEETEITKESELPYGEMLPDLKKLIKKIKKSNTEYEKYVKDKFLETEPYSKLLDNTEPNSEKREGLKKKIYNEIVSISESVECPIEGTPVVGGVCSYNVDGMDVNDLKVRLLSCNAPYEPLANEGLVDFETYITGVVYQEVRGYSDDIEVLKAQAVAARNYALTRNKHVGAGIGTIEQFDGQWVINLRACTDDMAYCNPDEGCWSNAKGGERAYVDESGDPTIHAGFDASKKWKLEPLPQDSEIRQAVKETAGVVALDVDGNIVYTPFSGAVQTEWQGYAKSGMDYQQIISKYYSSVSYLSSDCVASGVGQIRMPLDDGTYYIASPYGNRVHPVYNTVKFHSGIDMGTLGTMPPIYAIAPGKVTFSGWNGGYGNCIILSHDTDLDGNYDYHTLYAHCSELYVQEGADVPGGTVIAKVGSTGISTGNHLHFEMREGSDKNSKTIDPQPFLDDIKAGTSVFNNMIRTEKKYYNQGDYSNVQYCPGMNSSLQESGCLPTAFAMVVAALRDSSVTPATVANNICTNYKEYRVEGSGTNQEILNNSKFKSQYKIRGIHETSDYENKIKSALQSNKMIIVNVQGGIFNPSGAGHFFVLAGINSDGTVEVYDPGSRAHTKNYKISDFLNNISTGIWIFE